MHSLSFLVALLFAFIATSHAFPSFSLEGRKGDRNSTSKGNSTKTDSITRTCKHMTKLTALTDLTNNQTHLDALVAKGKLDDAAVAALKIKAADATSQLQTLMSNTTLVGECAVIDAQKKDVRMCKQMAKLTKLAAMKDNQTAIDAMVAKKGLDATQVAKLQEKISNATADLQEMMGNSTLTTFCANMQQQKGASGCK